MSFSASLISGLGKTFVMIGPMYTGVDEFSQVLEKAAQESHVKFCLKTLTEIAIKVLAFRYFNNFVYLLFWDWWLSFSKAYFVLDTWYVFFYLFLICAVSRIFGWTIWIFWIFCFALHSNPHLMTGYEVFHVFNASQYWPIWSSYSSSFSWLYNLLAHGTVCCELFGLLFAKSHGRFIIEFLKFWHWLCNCLF